MSFHGMMHTCSAQASKMGCSASDLTASIMLSAKDEIAYMDGHPIARKI
jgi:hypothetical protein